MSDAVYNPNSLPVSDLPIIYGFNNGGTPGWFSGVLLAEDGEHLGGHVCSQEGFMRGDLGIEEGTRPDRHETFRQHYPNGYRMAFVPHDEVRAHAGLCAALKRNQEQAEPAAREGAHHAD